MSALTKYSQEIPFHHLIKIGLLRELYRQRQITQAQFERLMALQRA